MSETASLLESLNCASAPYRDPLEKLNWDSLDLDIWWLPPEALSLAGVARFDGLPDEVRRRLSQYEFVHLLEAGLWLESVFIHRLGRELDRTDQLPRRARYLHEIREEAGHSLMFLELMLRSGVRLPDARRSRPRFASLLARLAPARGALFWAFVVIGEELPDKLNRTVRSGVQDATLSALIYHMTMLHIIDEARHIAHSRAACAEAAQALPRWRRRLCAPLLSAALRGYAAYVYYPPQEVYARAGLPRGIDWRRAARANETRRRFVRHALQPTMAFLDGCGWKVRVSDV